MSSSAAHEKDKLSAMNNDIVSPGLIMEDNKAAIHLAERGKSNSSPTKHIKIWYFFIKQYLDNGEFILIHCPTNQMIADILRLVIIADIFLYLTRLVIRIYNCWFYHVSDEEELKPKGVCSKRVTVH